MITWLHISDLHMPAGAQQPGEFGRAPVLDALWRDIDARADIDPDLANIDFVFFTGDLTFSGRRQAGQDEYGRAHAEFLQPLSQHAAVPLDRFFLVPGNHDVDRNRVDTRALVLQKGLDSQETIAALFEDQPMADERDYLFGRLREYGSFVAQTFPHLGLDPQTLGFTVSDVQTRSAVHVRVVGLNSSWLAYGGDEDEKRLVIGEWQLRHHLTDDTILTIVLLHHPVVDSKHWYHDMEQTTLNQLRSRADIILAGHLQAPDVASELTPSGPTIRLVAGPVFEKRDWPNTYIYGKFDVVTGRGTAYVRTYTDTGPTGPTWGAVPLGGRANGSVPLRLEPDSVDDASDARLVADLVRHQKKDLGNRPLLAGYDDRDAINSLFPDVYVDPFVTLWRDPKADPIRLGEWFASEWRPDQSVLVLAPPGAGKTTSMIALHAILAESYITGKSVTLPLFIDARLMPGMAITQDGVLARAAQTAGLDSSVYSAVPRPAAEPVVIVDGIDEAPMGGGAANVTPAVLPEFPHVATCRIDFYERHLSGPAISIKYSEIAVIQPWQAGRELPQFLNAYFTKVYGRDEWQRELADFTAAMVDSLDRVDLISTPLAVTILLFIWQYDRGNVAGLGVTNSASLLRRFLDVWSRRETGGTQSHITAPDALLKAYEIVALHLTAPELPREWAAVTRSISRSIRVKADLLADDRALHSLLRLRMEQSRQVDAGLGVKLAALLRREQPSIPMGGSERVVVSFAHEMLREYLIARRIVRALEGDRAAADALFLMPSHAVNAMVRQLLAGAQQSHMQKVIRRLAKAYNKARRHSGERWIIYRDNICYFWGRLEADAGGRTLKALYERIRAGKVHEHPMVSGSIGTGVLLTNDADVEGQYLNSIADGSADDVRNRKYHLVYYGDCEYVGPDGYLQDSPTPGQDDWPRTRAALIKRMTSSGPRARALRGLDIVTYMRFCQTRGVPDHTPEDLGVLQTCTDDLGDIPQGKVDIIRAWHNQLMETLGGN